MFIYQEFKQVSDDQKLVSSLSLDFSFVTICFSIR